MTHGRFKVQVPTKDSSQILRLKGTAHQDFPAEIKIEKYTPLPGKQVKLIVNPELGLKSTRKHWVQHLQVAIRMVAAATAKAATEAVENFRQTTWIAKMLTRTYLAS